jgi:hypothetical protein
MTVIAYNIGNEAGVNDFIARPFNIDLVKKSLYNT